MSFYNFVLIFIYIVATMGFLILALKIEQPSIQSFFITYMPLFIGFIFFLVLSTRWNMYDTLVMIDIEFIILDIYELVLYKNTKKKHFCRLRKC